MPLSAGSAAGNTGLAGAIRSHLAGVNGFRDGTTEGNGFCDALAQAIVAYVVANALILPTALIAPSGGGAVTGTGTLT